MNSFSLKFANPWLLLLLIPLIGLALIPYLRLPKRRRRTRNRVVSLIIHILILALCVPLLSGMTFHTEKVLDTFDVVLVVDASASSENSKDDIKERVRSILNEENASGFNIGIVTFANDQVYVSEMNDNPAKVWEDYSKNNRIPDASATNIADALYYAKGLLKEITNSRIIILSDGLATDGDAVTAAKAIAEEGVTVYGIHIDHETYAEEVQINKIEVGENAAVGADTDIKVTFQSSRSGMVKLTVYDNGKACEKQNISLSGGIESKTISHEFTEDGLHEIAVKIESETDTLDANNSSCAYAYIDVSSKILVVDGTGFETGSIKALLNDDYDVNIVRTGQVPKTLAALKEYSGVILMNVNMNDLPDGYDGILNTYVHEYGGGLLTVSGDEFANAIEDMADSHFNEMLPIDLDDDGELALELIIVMDISSSMEKTMTGSRKQRIAVAKEGVIESIKALKDSDYVGIVTFDENARIFQQISPATQRDSIISKVGTIRIGFGTKYTNALQTAYSMLISSKNNADKQHVIFLTDGNPNDPSQSDYESVIRQLARRDITVSTIAMFDENDPDLGDINALKARVQTMARLGNGNCYIVTSAAELPEIMAKETRLSQRELYNEKTVIPEFRESTIGGIQNLPQLEGYWGVAAKGEATVFYAAGDDPIYAEWQYGNGRVGSFMSDLNGELSRAFFNNDEGKSFIRGIVNNIQQTYKSMEVEFVSDNYTTIVNVTKEVAAGSSMTANITAPDGSMKNVVLNVTGANGYSGTFPTDMPGVYTVYLEEHNEAGDTIATATEYTTFSYSEEYDAFADPLDGYKTLDEICKSGEGRIVLPTEQLFSQESLAISNDYDPSLPMIIIVLILFLLDIAVRKFNFKWIHEIVRDHKEKKQRS